MGGFINILTLLTSFDALNYSDFELKIFENFEEATKYHSFYTLPFKVIYKSSKYYFENVRYKHSLINNETNFDEKILLKIKNCSNDRNQYHHSVTFETTKRLIIGSLDYPLNLNVLKLLDIIYIPNLTLEESSEILELFYSVRSSIFISNMFTVYPNKIFS